MSSGISIDANLTPPADLSAENTWELWGREGSSAGRYEGSAFYKNLSKQLYKKHFGNNYPNKNFIIENTNSFFDLLALNEISLVIDPVDGAECFGFPNGSTIFIQKTLEGIQCPKPITNVANNSDPSAINGFALIGRDIGPGTAILLALHDGPDAIENDFIRLKNINNGFAPILYLESVFLKSTRLASIAGKLASFAPPSQWGYDYPTNPNTPPVEIKVNSRALSCVNENYPSYFAPHPASICFLWETIIQGFDLPTLLSGFNFIYIRESSVAFCNNGFKLENAPLVDISAFEYSNGLSGGNLIEIGTNIQRVATINVISKLNSYETVYNIPDSANLKLVKITSPVLGEGQDNTKKNLETQLFRTGSLNQKDPRVVVTNASPAPNSAITLQGVYTASFSVTHILNNFMSYGGGVTLLDKERFEQVGTGVNTRYYYRGLDPRGVSIDLRVFGTNTGSGSNFKAAIGLNSLDKNHANINLAGTISYTSGSNIITGVGTSFLADFDKKNEIVDVSNNIRAVIKNVISNTSLEVTTNFSSSATGASYKNGLWEFLDKQTSPINLATNGSSLLFAKYKYDMSTDDYFKIYTFNNGTNALNVTSLQVFADGIV
jgi:hypothetical protein